MYKFTSSIYFKIDKPLSHFYRVMGTHESLGESKTAVFCTLTDAILSVASSVAEQV